ncbi:hypothetical protein CAEBREN_04905 [Caenorhabditis brenneri]|uniref:F-box domain-containing protein n=1 Tax=Caenorhabditis brenneri TaxID=135651 RepID=G0NGH7_CAEBE|nr:hypothetical protein CAEBREN_04905 [Caenorhabditis brenneri]
MPIEVVDIIVGKVDAASKLSVRKTTKILRSIVDSQKTKCKSVSLSLNRYVSKLRIENSLVTYRSEKDTFSKYKALNEYDSSDSDEDSPKWKLRKWAKMKTIVEDNHLKVALNDFSSFLMNPNWKFKKLTIDFGSDQGHQWREVEEAKLIRALDPLLSKFQIHLENLTVKSATLLPAVTFLPYFKSGVLKALGFSSDVMDRDILEKIMKMDHWKDAEKFKFEKIPDWFDIQNLFHAKRFTVENCTIDEERLVKIRDVLLDSKTFEACTLKTSNNADLWDERQNNNELLHNITDLVDRVLRDSLTYDSYMDEYLNEATGKSYTITVYLSCGTVELKIEQVPPFSDYLKQVEQIQL